MFLIYADESGEIKNNNENVFVLGAVSIYENQAFFLSQEFDKIQDKWFPNASSSIEFHGSKMFNGNGEPWHSVTRDQRKNIFKDLCGAIKNVTPKGLSLFGIIVQKRDSAG